MLQIIFELNFENLCLSKQLTCVQVYIFKRYTYSELKISRDFVTVCTVHIHLSVRQFFDHFVLIIIIFDSFFFSFFIFHYYLSFLFSRFSFSVRSVSLGCLCVTFSMFNSQNIYIRFLFIIIFFQFHSVVSDLEKRCSVYRSLVALKMRCFCFISVFQSSIFYLWIFRMCYYRAQCIPRATCMFNVQHQAFNMTSQSSQFHQHIKTVSVSLYAVYVYVKRKRQLRMGSPT